MNFTTVGQIIRYSIMQKITFFFIGLFLIALSYSCADEPNFPPEPEIDFVSIGKTVLNQAGINGDTTIVTISFQDGDGDLGGDPLAIFLLDTRTDFLDSIFRLPEIPLDGVSNSITGEIIFFLPETCCIYDNGQIPCESSTAVPQQELVYELYIKDRAGNQSNSITLPTITLLCN